MSALNKKSFLTYLKEGGIYVVLLVLLAIIIFQDPTFLSLLNLSNILTQSSVRIIIALGVAGLIVTQGTDLSAGRQVGLAAVVADAGLRRLLLHGQGQHRLPLRDLAGPAARLQR